jgi:hypothetical protein
MEQNFRLDLTGDHQIGRPARIIHAEVSRDGGRNITYADLPDEGAQLVQFLRAVLAGGDLSEARWTPARNGFSKSDYWSIISTLIRSGVLRWRNDDAHAQGVELTAEGPEILEQWLAELAPLPYAA